MKIIPQEHAFVIELSGRYQTLTSTESINILAQVAIRKAMEKQMKAERAEKNRRLQESAKRNAGHSFSVNQMYEAVEYDG